jgi:hypothetical protein
MLSIKNIDKIIGVDGCLVQVKSIHAPNVLHPHPQKTYDIVFEHKDRTGREFFLTIDREGAYHNMRGETDYPISFWELTGPHNQSMDVSIWEKNLLSPTLFLNFIDNLIHHYTT